MDELKEMAADLSYRWIKFWNFILQWFFHHVYEGFTVDPKEFQRVKEIVGKYPVILVPSHRSHVDYLLLSYLFYQERLPVPRIAAGKNLSFWPMRYIFRKSGAYFIRRNFGKDPLYRSRVKAYVKTLIQQKCIQEFFIEGTRSRTGKLNPPQIGLLSIFMDCFFEGAVEDLYFVPIAISYEKVLEDYSYIQEMKGVPKTKESFWNLLRIKSYLKRKSGKIYVSFAEPISLKKSLSGRSEDEEKQFALEFAGRLIDSIRQLSQVTASSLVAAALLVDPDPKQTESILFQRIEALSKMLKLKQARFCEPLEKNRTEALHQALSRWIEEGVIQKYQENSETIYGLIPSQRAILDYYKNNLAHYLELLWNFTD